MSRLEKQDVLPTLKGLLARIEKEENLQVYAYEKDAVQQIIKQYETEETPLVAYSSLESWLYEQGDKPIEIRSAMLWGGLWVIKQMGCIDWDEMRSIYGGFMSVQMDLR